MPDGSWDPDLRSRVSYDRNGTSDTNGGNDGNDHPRAEQRKGKRRNFHLAALQLAVPEAMPQSCALVTTPLCLSRSCDRDGQPLQVTGNGSNDRDSPPHRLVSCCIMLLVAVGCMWRVACGVWRVTCGMSYVVVAGSSDEWNASSFVFSTTLSPVPPCPGSLNEFSVVG